MSGAVVTPAEAAPQPLLPGMTWRERIEWERRRADFDETDERTRALQEWLPTRQRWNWFATFTFRPRTDNDDAHTLPYCKRALDRLLADLGRVAGYTKRQVRGGNGLRGFVAWERHKSGAWHAHALIAGTRSLSWRVAKEIAFERTGIARIYPIDADAATRDREVRYVAKYTAKGPEVWDLFGCWSSDDQLSLPLVLDEDVCSSGAGGGVSRVTFTPALIVA